MNQFVELDKDSAAPLYWQIYQQIRAHILNGRLPPNSRLPASRTLAQQCGVARETVKEAYDQLSSEGFVARRVGAGTFVTPTLLVGQNGRSQPPVLTAWGQQVMQLQGGGERPLDGRPQIDFGFGRSFPHIFPYAIWRRLLARYLSTDDVMLSRYGSVAGFEPLRQAIAAYLSWQRGVVCQPEQVVIVNGAQQALDLLARLLLTPHDQVLMETPGYADAYTLFQTHGVHVNTVPVDDHGLPIEAVPPQLQAKLVFVTPSNQFPHGGAMPVARRLRLLAWAQRHGAYIVEDDYDGALRYNGRPLAALQGLDQADRVIYLGTFSKVLFPALRLAYIVLPPPLVTPFIRAKQLVDRGAPTLTQAAVSDFITEGHFERHLRHLRQAYGARREKLVAAIRQHLPSSVTYAQEPAGLHIMLYLSRANDEAALVAQAAQADVRVYPGAPYHLQRPERPSILLGFSGLSQEDIAQGVARLGTIVQP